MGAAPAGFEFGGTRIAPGARQRVDLPVADLYTSTPVTLPVRVVHGRAPGPVVFLSAALHGDEINGVEILRRLARMPVLDGLRGTLLVVPIVNTLAFLHQSRYLPDRRDLNRSFPGSETGSLAARLAHLFVQSVVRRCDYGVDLHTGAVHRPNLPQIRGDLAQPQVLRLARAFGVPLMLASEPTRGTLRDYTTGANIPVILYEGGEALRFDEVAIRIGVQGVLNVLYELDMLERPESASADQEAAEPVAARSSTWVRAPASGMLRAQAALGDLVRKGQRLALVGDPFGEVEQEALAPDDGVIIGRLHLPLVHEGDALFHLARVDDPRAVSRALERMRRRVAAPERGPSGEPAVV